MNRIKEQALQTFFQEFNIPKIKGFGKCKLGDEDRSSCIGPEKSLFDGCECPNWEANDRWPELNGYQVLQLICLASTLYPLGLFNEETPEQLFVTISKLLVEHKDEVYDNVRKLLLR